MNPINDLSSNLDNIRNLHIQCYVLVISDFFFFFQCLKFRMICNIILLLFLLTLYFADCMGLRLFRGGDTSLVNFLY